MKKLVNGVEVDLTAEEITARQAEEVEANKELAKAVAKQTERNEKQEGVTINGVKCSATRADQNGLTAIAMAVLIARGASTVIPETVFEFENGATLTVNDGNFDGYYAIWMPFRQKFFAGS